MGASVSENGTLVYARALQTAQQLTWFDRAGRAVGKLGEPARYNSLALSPDERRVAIGLGTGTQDNRDISIIDIAHDLRTRLTSIREAMRGRCGRQKARASPSRAGDQEELVAAAIDQRHGGR